MYDDNYDPIEEKCPECGSFETYRYWRCPGYLRNGISYSCSSFCDNQTIYACEKCPWTFYDPPPTKLTEPQGKKADWLNDYL